ncbi:MAG: hypothetical protein C5B50_20925 [Verrucomicrobia bacterium]|nr:MAG: hypothetical protein C5B50_20925 [Verrucomicrobiota bacterium]
MNLPNYFLADLPSDATLSPALLREACQTLKYNRERYLADRSTRSLVDLLDGLAEDWLKENFPFRAMALEQGPAATGFSAATLAAGLDSFFKQLTKENLHSLLEQDLGHVDRLDELCATTPEREGSRSSKAVGPEFLFHITAGGLPSPALSSIILGLLVRSAQFVKCASGASLVPRLFAHSLYETEPKLGACLELAEWPGGSAQLEEVLFAEADCVTATGTDETLAAIRLRVPPKTKFLGYGHRVSFAFISSKALSARAAHKQVERAVADVVAWDQLGCLSPHVIYVENGGHLSPVEFALAMSKELAQRELREPRGRISVEVAATIASRRSFYEIRAIESSTQLFCSPGSTAWTVIYEEDPRFQLSCLHRFIYVKGVKDLNEALQSADSVRGLVSTVGLAAADDEAPDLARELADWGVPRICPVGQMQNPPLTWRHDGRPSLGDLVRWTDWERE